MAVRGRLRDLAKRARRAGRAPCTATRWRAPSSGCGSSSSRSGRSRSSASTWTRWSATTGRDRRCPGRAHRRAGSAAAGQTSRRTRSRRRRHAVPFVREEQQKRLRAAERALAMLGRVNPLALEEFLPSRSGTSSSASSSRTSVAPAATCSTSSVRSTSGWSRCSPRPGTTSEPRSSGVFQRLFPGGEGGWCSPTPTDMLSTGIEVEARPAGKKVKRLSLLSGGERSLVAVAFLVSLFKARPSPFYILDEVEAALDDTNLGPAAGDLRGAAREQPAARHHPPEAHDGGRRRALRRQHARRRGVRGDQPAAARGRADCVSGHRVAAARPGPRRTTSYGAGRPPAGRTTTSTAT